VEVITLHSYRWLLNPTNMVAICGELKCILLQQWTFYISFACKISTRNSTHKMKIAESFITNIWMPIVFKFLLYLIPLINAGLFKFLDIPFPFIHSFIQPLLRSVFGLISHLMFLDRALAPEPGASIINIGRGTSPWRRRQWGPPECWKYSQYLYSVIIQKLHSQLVLNCDINLRMAQHPAFC